MAQVDHLDLGLDRTFAQPVGHGYAEVTGGLSGDGWLVRARAGERVWGPFSVYGEAQTGSAGSFVGGGAEVRW